MSDCKTLFNGSKETIDKNTKKQQFTDNKQTDKEIKHTGEKKPKIYKLHAQMEK